MLWAIRQLLLTVHILLAVIWVGGILFVGWGLFPAARKLSYSVQQKLFVAVMEWTHWLFTLAGYFNRHPAWNGVRSNQLFA